MAAVEQPIGAMDLSEVIDVDLLEDDKIRTSQRPSQWRRISNPVVIDSEGGSVAGSPPQRRQITSRLTAVHKLRVKRHSTHHAPNPQPAPNPPPLAHPNGQDKILAFLAQAGAYNFDLC
jgi:hypothetical protein